MTRPRDPLADPSPPRAQAGRRGVTLKAMSVHGSPRCLIAMLPGELGNGLVTTGGVVSKIGRKTGVQ
jgi:hypothetical protein